MSDEQRSGSAVSLDALESIRGNTRAEVASIYGDVVELADSSSGPEECWLRIRGQVNVQGDVRLAHAHPGAAVAEGVAAALLSKPQLISLQAHIRRRLGHGRVEHVAGICPACGQDHLILDDSGRVICSWVECPSPDAANLRLHGVQEAVDPERRPPSLDGDLRLLIRGAIRDRILLFINDAFNMVASAESNQLADMLTDAVVEALGAGR